MASVDMGSGIQYLFLLFWKWKGEESSCPVNRAFFDHGDPEVRGRTRRNKDQSAAADQNLSFNIGSGMDGLLRDLCLRSVSYVEIWTGITNPH
jgi:hypothetical protein